MLEARNLAGLAGLRHGFFTRQGGVSEGPFASLNCGYSSGDDPERVDDNRARAIERLGMPASSLVTARQVHGIRVLTVRAPAPGRPEQAADALVTDVSDLALGVLSADCAPVLLADVEAGVIGAVHAGWRGALKGVVEAAIDAMGALGAGRSRIRAAIGPCIAQASYEVGPEFQAQFLGEDPPSAAHFAPAPDSDRLLFDLAGYMHGRLGRAGVRDIVPLGRDTLAEPLLFFSSRRAHKAGETRFGLLLSAIALCD